MDGPIKRRALYSLVYKFRIDDRYQQRPFTVSRRTQHQLTGNIAKPGRIFLIPRTAKADRGKSRRMCIIRIGGRLLKCKDEWFTEFHITVNIYQSDKPDTIDCFVTLFLTMSGIEKSPLARLLLFIVCLSIAVAFVAGAHYYIIDVPQQKALSGYPPANANTDTIEKCNTCRSYCPYSGNYYQCKFDCEVICD